jgi:transposase
MRRSDDIDIWAEDEVHFQQHGSRCRMWMPPEVRDPMLPHAPTRKSVGYFGAVRIRDGKFVYQREVDRFNAQTCWDFLIRLKRASGRSGRRVVVIIDNAKYHHALLHREWREECESDFRLEFLPPYSPDLNPVERVWKLLRRLRLHNQYFPTLGDVLSTVEDQFALWSQPNDALRKLCAIT